MSLIAIIETLFIGPLKLLFEVIFQLANRFVNHPGLSIIFLSLVMNILVLPLYRRADAMQEEARDIDAKLRDGVSHIKKMFVGDEKMMVLQTYYRQNNYKPTSALNGSVSLLLEIPFFMAAYQFLSHLSVLHGTGLGPITDLGTPDRLIVIGEMTINLLPVLMTLVNVISCVLYLKGFPLKTKIQLYGMALFFLVFLYNSPSGLVFYWTLNNVFSLVKTIFYKIKNSQKVLEGLMTGVGLVLIVFGAFIYSTNSLKRRVFLIGIGILLQMPKLLPILKAKIHFAVEDKQAEPNKKMFFLGSLFLALLVGVLIPTTFIAASPQEYVDITFFHHPLWYVVSSACMAIGTFLIWLRVFYWLASSKGKVVFDKLVWIMCGLFLVNYMFFGTNLGIISSTLQYEQGLRFSKIMQLLNLFVLAAVAIGMYMIAMKWKKIVTPVLLTAVIAFSAMSVMNIVKIKKSVDQVSAQQASEELSIPLSKNGQNVIVFMLDRAMNEYIPYMLNEKPELKEKFAGFTYYPNTISFGGHTNFAAPALLGGYEYTPVEMNKRDDESLMSKHNEAVLMMPKLFADNGYEVTVCDPVYANYQWNPDISLFNDYPEINAYSTQGVYVELEQKEQEIQMNHRNFFCFSIMKSMPLCVQPTIYSKGTYNQASFASGVNQIVQTVYNYSMAEGFNSDFMSAYNVLTNLSKVTHVTDEEVNTFLFMSNNTTHEPTLLQEPEYVPSAKVDNTQYDAANKGRFTIGNRFLDMYSERQISHYQVNMAALLRLGEWFDYLRENDVYDNTKIIIVADHGYYLYHAVELIFGTSAEFNKDAEFYYPLLMVKDFGSTEFTISDEFMTNADVPTLATQGVIENPTNPFTGKEINNDEKTAHDQYIIMSHDWDVGINNGNTFLPSGWATIKDNVWDRSQWEFHEDPIVLDEYKIP